jgi:hypothetical protein
MRNPAYQPPGFPVADNQRWTVRFYSGGIEDSDEITTTTNPATVLPLSPGFTSSKGN